MTGVVTGARVLAGVVVRGGVAAQGHAAGLAGPQVHPPRGGFSRTLRTRAPWRSSRFRRRRCEVQVLAHAFDSVTVPVSEVTGLRCRSRGLWNSRPPPETPGRGDGLGCPRVAAGTISEAAEAFGHSRPAKRERRNSVSVRRAPPPAPSSAVLVPDHHDRQATPRCHSTRPAGRAAAAQRPGSLGLLVGPVAQHALQQVEVRAGGQRVEEALRRQRDSIEQGCFAEAVRLGDCAWLIHEDSANLGMRPQLPQGGRGCRRRRRRPCTDPAPVTRHQHVPGSGCRGLAVPSRHRSDQRGPGEPPGRPKTDVRRLRDTPAARPHRGEQGGPRVRHPSAEAVEIESENIPSSEERPCRVVRVNVPTVGSSKMP